MSKKIEWKDNMRVLAIETSCDETAAAVVEDGRHVLSNVLYSQIDIHAQFGGVVPEVAARNHVKKLPFIVAEALEKADMDFAEVDAFAVTQGPGLVGALLTGVSAAKSFAYAMDRPLFGVNHMQGHISANYISHLGLEPPFICLVASGGHTNIIHVKEYTKYETLASTRDDAAGEAFDKVARVLGLSYPGGPNLEALAKAGNKDAYGFTKPFRGEEHLDFSFSGVKTGVINLIRGFESRSETYNKADVAASFQKHVVENLVENTFEAATRAGIKTVVLGGGVSANGALRHAAQAYENEGFTVYMPDLQYCTDNAAMIASAAYYNIMDGQIPSELSMNADPALAML